MGFRKRYVAICLMLLFLMIGAVAASDDAASDDAVQAAGDNATLTVENYVDEGEYLAQDEGSDSVVIESDDDSDKNVLSANDVEELDDEKQDVLLAVENEKNVVGAPAERDLLGDGNFATLDGYIDQNIENIDIYGYYYATGNGNPATLSNSNRVIDGHGGTWDRTTSYTGRILTISNTVSNVVFKNIIFKNGHANAQGGDNYGGAIVFGTGAAANNKNIKFINCTFDSNFIYTDEDHEKAYGGAIYFRGDASDIYFTNCTFKNNHVEGTDFYGEHGHESEPRGGAICFNDVATNINFNGCKFTNNQAYGALTDASTYSTHSNGGAICFFQTATTVNVIDCEFKNNNANTSGYQCTAYGGAISFMAASSGVKFDNVSFDNNHAYAVNPKGTNEATAMAGAIYISSTASGIPSFNKCTFENNAAIAGADATASYGAIYFGVASQTTSLTGLTFKDTKFIGNTASNSYPVMAFNCYAKGFTFDNVTFESNEGPTTTLYFGNTVSENTRIINCKFINNINNASNANGGAIYIPTANGVSIEGSTFDNNEVSGKGAGVYVNKGNSLKIDNCTFNNHEITDNGAAIYWGASNDFITHNSHFNNNKASEGATIFFANSINNIKIYDSTFTGNEITSSHGGALDASRASALVIEGSKFDSNIAMQNGAGVYIPYGSMQASITNCTFANHNLNGDGAAIYWGTSYAFNTDDSHFINNHAKNGAVIYFANTNLQNIVITDSTFTDNEVTSGNGGALNIQSNVRSTTIDRCTFKTNTAPGKGGAIYVDASDVSINHSNFTENADSGTANAIYVCKDRASNDIRNTEFNGANQIYIDEGAEVSLTKNTQKSPSNGYMLTNFKGTIALSQNNFTNVIINEYGTITTQTYANISNNKTYETWGFIFPLNATIVDDTSNNSIISYSFKFITNHNDHYEADDTLTHNYPRMITKYEYYDVGGEDDGLSKLFTYNAIIKAYPVEGSYTWLQDKIDKNDAFVLDRNITFNPDYDTSEYNRYYEINLTNGMRINKTFTLDGNGYTISGLNQARIFNISADDVNIKNTYFINATSKFNGGAFYITSGVSYLTISRCSFENANAKGMGGAIYADGNGQTIEISDSIFNANSAYGGGAIQFDEGSDFYEGIKIIGCTFTNNRELANRNLANNEWGGSAIGVKKATDVKITNSKFDNNVARSNGAVIFDYCSDVVFNACNFTNNSVTKSAGAVYFANIRDGKDKSVSFDSCLFINNDAKQDAGAIYSGSKFTEIKNSNFTMNTAINGAAIVLIGTFDVYKCHFENNTATGNGTIWVGNIESESDIEFSTFIGNKAYNGAGAYHAVKSIGAPRLFISYSDFINNTASHNGGAVYYMFDQGNAIYRDYDNFDGRGKIDPVSKKTTVNFTASSFSVEAIAKCLFENNIDYQFIVDTNQSYNTTGVIQVYVTREVDVGSINATVKLTDTLGNVTLVNVNSTNYRPYFNRDLGIFDIQFEGLQPNENYTVEVSFNDKTYLSKNTTTMFTTGFGRMGQFAYLQFLIERAIGNNTYELNLTRNFNYDLQLDKGQMHINTTFTLNLNGFIINARGQSRIFNITADNVVLKGIVFMNGDVNGPNGTDDKNGGAILWCGKNGTIMDSEFINNVAEYGGAVYFNSTATDSKIINCIFDNNTAAYNGGAIDCNATKMNLNHTTFTNNVAQYGAALCREANADGGFGYNNTFIANHALIAGAALGWMNSSKISIDTYYFYDNYADQMGGAIYVGNGSGECEILNCEFERNYVVNATDGHGGAIDWFATKGYIYNSRFTGNWARDGGALYIHTYSGNITINETEFAKNRAVNGLGGAINLEASAITVNKTNFIENIANEGGAIYAGGKGTTNYFYYCLFDGNIATATGGHGGAIDGASSSGCLFYSTLSNNRADYGGAIYMGGDSSNSSVYNSSFINNVARYNGGAIDWNATGGGLTNTEFRGNKAAFGAALCREIGAIGGYGSGNGFISNQATQSGGAIAWMGSQGINITNYFFYNNTAEVSGGAIYGGDGSEDCLITDSVFMENSVIMQDGKGGAMYITTGSSNILNTSFTGNHAGYGGAIFANSQAGNANISNTSFTRNVAKYDGGAINLESSTVTLNDTHFKTNRATNGGAIYVGADGKTNYVYYSTFDGNNASGGKGGAINWLASAGHILNSNITNNYADYGGGVYLGGNSENSSISHVIFDNNEAKYNGGAIDWNAIKGNLTHTTFKNNKAQYGAALCREAGATSGYGYNNTFEFNHAYKSGAALAWMGSEGININTYFFNDNWADVSGGAIYIAENSPDCVINNSQFNRNYVSNATGGYGGAIACLADNATILNTTFDDNYAFEGGAIYVGGVGYTSTVEYSSFTNNKATGANGGAIDWVASTGNIFRSNFTENSAIYGGAVYIGGDSQNSKISYVIFDTNKASKNGGAIDWNATGGNLTHTRFINNEADYGAALCREANSGGGFGFNNTFIKNHARISGAALAWLSTHGIKIDTYYFYNNTADVSGGSIFVDENSDECKVLNSVFSGGKVRDGRGGDIDWVGDNGYILNTTFSNSESSDGGSIYVDKSSRSTKIINSSFDDCISFGRGGAITWLGAEGKVINVNFTNLTAFESGGAIYGSANGTEITNVFIRYSTAAVAYREVYADYLGGSGISWVDSNGLEITNLTMMDIKSFADGTGIAAVNCNNSKLYNVTVLGSISLKNGGSVYWVNSSNLEIELGNFVDTAAAFGGGAIYLYNVDTTIKDTKFNHTQSPWGLGGAIYVHADVDISNSTFERYEAENGNASAIYFDSGISNVDDSQFNGINPLFIAENANVTLIHNNVTESDKGMYSVWNDGNLWLENNKFDNYIYNNGTIWTRTYTYMLDNETHNATWMDDYEFFATIYDDTHENQIISVSTLNTTNNVYQDVGNSYLLPYNKKVIKAVYQGSFMLEPNDKGLKDNIPFNGTINVKMPLKLELEHVVSEDKVTVTATITPVGDRSNFTLQKKLTFIFNGESHEVNLTWNEIPDEHFKAWNKAVAVFELNNLSAGYYKVTALYSGDEIHEYAENLTEFEVKLRQTWIEVYVANITYGQYALANVTTNGNGTVLLFLNGRYEKYNLTKGDGYYGNYSIVNGTLLVEFDTLYGPGNYSMAVVYMEDEYYAYALNQTQFTVFKQNTTINATPTNITYLLNETINVTVHENATGYIKITIGPGQEYVAEIRNGTAIFNIPNLPAKTYTNVEVWYRGDQYINGNKTYINFTISATDDFNMTVAAPEIEYGQNATVIVNVHSDADGNVTLFIDGDTVGRTVNVTDGVAIFDDISGLAGGDHYLNVTYNGGKYFSSKNITNYKLKVNPTTDWKMNITVEENPYGEYSTVTVTLPTNMANKNMTIKIGNNSHVVNITGNKAVLRLNNLTSGIHECSATYAGDDNYSFKDQKFRFHIVKAQPTVNLTIDENGVVSANVTGKNITGTVTFHVNGRNYTRDIHNNIATLNNLTVGENNVVAIYNGDNNHFRASSADTYPIEKYDSLVNVTADATPYGQAVEITVTVGVNQTGFVKIIVNDEVYIAELNDTVAKFYVSGLDVREYEVNVTFYEDESFKEGHNSTKFNVTKGELDVTVIAQNMTVEQNASFVITVPSDFSGMVNITVDGKTYIREVSSLVEIEKLLAGNKNATLLFYNSNKYKNKEVNVSFVISRVNPKINVTIADVVYPDNATAIVVMPGNAKGTIEIWIGNTRIGNGSIENGNAQINITRLETGYKEVVIKFISNDSYYNDIATVATFNVFNNITPISIEVNNSYVGETVKVIVTVPADVEHNVTLEIDGQKLNATAVNGRAEFNVTGLLAGNKTVTAIYAGDNKYLYNATTKKFQISKYNSTYFNGTSLLNVTVEDIDVGEVLRINLTSLDDYTGLVIVNVDGVNYTAIMTNGTGFVEISKLASGHYNVTATLMENDKYSTYVNNTQSFNVSKLDSPLNVTFENITDGENLELNIRIPAEAFGNVTVSITGMPATTVAVQGGLNTIIIPNLIVGNYDVQIKYNGNYRFKENTSSVMRLYVAPSTPKEGFVVKDLGNKTVMVTVPDNATGNITIKIGNRTYNATINNSVAFVDLVNETPGVYIANVTYSGDDTHNPLSVNETVKIPRYATPIRISVESINVGQTAYITVTVIGNITQNVTIEIDGKKYNKTIDDATGKAIFEIDGLTAGNKTVAAIYAGDLSYSFNATTANFTVSKLPTKVNATTSPINVSDIATIYVNGPDDITGYVIVTVDGVDYTVTLTGGHGFVDISGLANGTYPVAIAYLENDKYKYEVNSTQLIVSKKNTRVGIDVENITYGEVAQIEFTVPGVELGNLTVKINNDEVTVPVAYGKAYLNLTGLAARNYTIKANFTGNYKFNAVNNTKVFEVKKATPVMYVVVNEVQAGHNATITVYINSTATGNITVKVNGTEYNATIVGYKANITTNALPAGAHTINVTYWGDNNYTMAHNNDSDSASKLNVTEDIGYSINITIADDDIDVEENVVIIVSVPVDAGKNVTIWINDDKHENVEVINGNATLSLKINEEGLYLVNATFGDDKYANKTVYAAFRASKVITPIGITVNDSYVGQIVKVTVTVPNGLDNNVTIEIDGQKLSAKANGGIAEFNVTGLVAGTKTITAIYIGDNKYLYNSTSRDFIVRKYNSTSLNGTVLLNVTVEDDDIEVGDIAKINLTGPIDYNGTVVVRVGGVNYTVILTNGIGYLEINKLTNDTYLINATLGENDKYSTYVNDTVEFIVSKRTSQVGVEFNNITVGENAIFIVDVSDFGNLTITIAAENTTVAVKKGRNTIIIPDLKVGTHNVTVKYSGNYKYSNSSSALKQIKVSQVNTTENDVTIEDSGNGTVIIHVSDNATGNVTVYINGENKTIVINNGTAVVNLSEFNNTVPGENNITIIYSGDENHTGVEVNSTVIVPRYESEINVTAIDIKEGGVEYINVNVTSGATGRVLLNITGAGMSTGYYVDLTNSAGVLKLIGLAEGSYTVKATYLGDNNYTESVNNASFVVTAGITIDISGSGNNTSINITVPGNATGNVTVLIDNVVYNVTNLTNGSTIVYLNNVTPGEHNVTVIYTDANGTNTTASKVIIVSLYDTPISIEVVNTTVGDLTKFTVTVPVNATGDVTIKIDGRTITNVTSHGVAVFYVAGLTAGNKTVTAYYAADEIYAFNATSKEFNITKISREAYGDTPLLNVTVVNSDIKVGDIVRIDFTAPGDYNGTVVVRLNGGVNYTATLTNGRGFVDIAKLSEGIYYINATLTENDKYFAYVNDTVDFTVTKRNSPIVVNFDNITSGENAVLYVTAPDYGNAIIKLTNLADIEVAVKEGVNMIIIQGLAIGDYEVNVTYSGNYKYLSNSSNGKILRVSKHDLSPEDIIIDDSGNGTIIITVPGNATGNVSVTINNVTQVLNLTDGSATFNLTNITNATPGPNTITVEYSGDGNHSGLKFNTTVTIPKWKSSINATGINIIEGYDEIVTVNVAPVNATGIVMISIGNRGFFANVTEGVAKVILSGLAAGKYNDIVVKYSGNENYSESFTTVSFVVASEPEINTTGGGNGIIVVNVGDNTTNGTIQIIIDNQTYNGTIVNGTAHVDLTNVTPGDHNATIIYTDNSTNNTFSYDTIITILRWNSAVTINTTDIMVGGTEVIRVNVTAGATGRVLFNITGAGISTGYYVDLTNSAGVLRITGLAEGSYTVKVTYLGDKNYTESVNNGSFIVNPGIEINIDGSGNNTAINITVPGNATGNVTVIIDNQTYNVTNLTNGSAIVYLNNVTPGEHNITVIYTDGNGTNTTASKVIIVSLYDTPISIEVVNTTVGDLTKFTVTVPVNATGDVTIKIDGRTITNVTSHGVAVFYVAGLTAGNKTVTAYYAADELYAFNATSKEFNITKISREAYGDTPLLNVTVVNSDIKVGDVVRIDFTAPGDYNGTVVVRLNGGVNYTATLTNGRGFVEIDKLLEGLYYINATLAENDKYFAYVNDTVNFTVTKRESQVSVEFNNITVGENAVLIVNVTDFGNVTITIAGEDIAVYAGINTIIIPDLTVGTHDVIVTYNGNYKYLNSSSALKQIKVSPINTTEDDVTIEDSGNGTVIIHVGDNATGNVTVYINGENKTIVINNGTAVVNLSEFNNTIPGENNITIVYSGDENHTGVEVNSTVIAPRYESEINVTAINIMEGGVEYINVNVTSGATGRVLLNITGAGMSTGYYVDLTNSAGVLRITGLAEGSYTVKATYLGDNNYTESVDNASFIVSAGIEINIDGSGNNTVINITVPGNATGNVTVLIDNQTYNVTNLTNGSAIVYLNNVTPGEHNITVIYIDGNGTNTTANKVIIVSLYDTPISIEVVNTTVGDLTKFTVTVPVNATGDVTIKIDGRTITNVTSHGVAVFYVAGLTAGNKTVTAYYAADELYAFNATSKEFNITKISREAYGDTPLLNVTVVNSDIKVGDIVRINFAAPGDYNGTVVVRLNGGVNYTATLTNGIGFVEIDKLLEGIYYINATLAENDKYFAYVNDTVNFTVTKRESQVSVEFNNITVGENAVLIVNVTDFGNVTITIAGEDIAVYAGTNTIIIPDLTVGTHDVIVTYNGNYKYLNSSSALKQIKVSPINTTEDDVTIEDSGNGTVIIHVGDNATGNVTVYINGENKTIVINNGTAVVNLSEFNNTIPGENNITIIYTGDENHTGIEVNKTVIAPRYESEINVTAINIMEGGVEYINVNVTSGATGRVLLNITGAGMSTGYYVDLTNSAGVLKIIGLVEGSYTVKATYLGDNNYTESVDNASFVVTAGITIDVGGSGNNTAINITVPGNATGNVTVLIDGVVYNVTNLTNGSAVVYLNNVTPGEHNVTVIYTDANGTNTTANKVITVSLYDTPIDIQAGNIHVGDVAEIIVYVPYNATGNVTIRIDGRTITNVTSHGVAVFYVAGLTAGNKTVTAYYAADELYAFNATSKDFNITKFSPEDYGNAPLLNVTVEDTDIKVGDIVRINFAAPDDYNGTVVVRLNGDVNYTATLTNGRGFVDIAKLSEGIYYINATLAENDKYFAYVNDTVNFTVSKRESQVSVEFNNITVGENAVLIVNVTDFGNVTITIAGEDIAVYAGTNTIIIPGLTVGTHDVIVTYNGNYKYLNSSSVLKQIKVSPINTTEDDVTIEDSGNGTVIIHVGDNATGNVTVYINGENKTIIINNGTAVVNLSEFNNTIPGENNITIIYSGDENHTGIEINKTVIAPRYESAINVTAIDIKEGGVEYINVNVTSGATGRVLLNITGAGMSTGYYVDLTNSAGVLKIIGLAEGSYTVKATYLGDNNYTESVDNASFVVTAGINVDVGGSGNNTVINITVPGNATGNVTVLIDNETYIVTNLTNGSAIINLTNVTPGEHNVTVIYTDGNGTNTTANKVITVSKYDTPIDIKVENLYVGDTTKITVTVPVNATEDITIGVGGKTYANSTTNGVATFYVTGLTAGDKTIVAIYPGDATYAFNATAGNFTMLKHNSQITVSVDNIVAGDYALVKVSALPGDATGFVIVDINGTKYGINITNGENSVSALINTAGTFDVVATYLGDDKYSSAQNSDTFEAAKVLDKVDIIIKNPSVNEVVTYVVIPTDATGNATVIIDNKTVKVVSLDGGLNNIVISNVSEGQHNVTVKYDGDKYESKTVSEMVNVMGSIIAPKNLIRAWNSPYDYEAEFLNEEGYILANTNVKIVADGKEYTVKTDEKGVARLTDAHLSVGKHKVTLINPVTGQQVTETVNIVERIIGNKDITLDFYDGTQYIVRAIGDDGKPVGAGEVVGFHVNGVDYNGITDKDGYARLKINLNPKSYTITAQYRAYKVSNKITVKQTLKLVKKTVTVKKSAKSLKIKATLKWTNGKAIKGKKLTLILKNKKYSAKTNSKGIATFTIKSAVIKKLSAGKKYVYSVKYIKNYVKGTLKVKK